MRHAVKNNYDKSLLVLAMVVLGVSCAWYWKQQPALRRLHGQRVRLQLEDSVYTPVSLRPPEQVAVVWAEATSQSHGRRWLYDVFTPPVIHYSPASKSFTVTSDVNPVADEARFGLELLAVKQEPYRLQLVGYVGGPGDYLAAFTSPNLAETFLIRTGHRVAALGLTLKSFDVKKVAVKHNDARPGFEVAALALLSDERTGTDLVLDSRWRKFTDTPLAVLNALAGGGGPREMHEGEAFSDGTSTYRVEHIQLDPPEVAVACERPDRALPEIRILHPVRDAVGELAAIAVAPSTGRVTAGLAVNEQ